MMQCNFGESIARVSDRSDKGNFEDAHILTERMASIGRDLQQILAGLASKPRLSLIDFAPVNQAAMNLMQALKADPEKLAAAQADLARRFMGVLQELTEEIPDETLDTSSRYSDPAWRDNPFFDMSRRMHESFAGWLMDLPETTPGLEENERKVLRFWFKQVTSSLSPANNPVTNPRAATAYLQSGGKSLATGVTAMTKAIDPKTGRLNIAQTDVNAFKIGESVAATPGKVVFQNELIELICYSATTDEVHTRPVLIIPPWINKYYVLDLTARKSFAGWIRDQGVTTYMISWRQGCADICEFGWSDYLDKGLIAALDFIRKRHDTSVNAVGYCAGGSLLASFAAYQDQTSNDSIASITLMAAQTDFSHPGDLSVYITPRSVELLEAEIARSGGIMRGELIADAFNLLRPEDLIWRPIEERYLLGIEPEAFDILFWNSDYTHIPGPLLLDCLRRLYMQNAIAAGEFEVFGRNVGLHDINTPAFVQSSERDHISPSESVFRGAQLMSGPVKYLVAESGHIAGVINPPGSGKYGYWSGSGVKNAHSARVWAALGTHTKGSWWPEWMEWLEQYSGGTTKPKKLSSRLPDAPGNYVRERYIDG